MVPAMRKLALALVVMMAAVAMATAQQPGVTKLTPAPVKPSAPAKAPATPKTAPSTQSAPPPVPALPDAPRLTSFNLTAGTCACSVGFALYGDGTDVDNWIDVFINGVSYPSTDMTHGWTLTSPTGSLGSIPLPITDAILTFNQPQTGSVAIVGARRPRRVSQFPETRGVTARELNQVITDIVAQNRETWDKLNRAIVGQPGEVMLPLPAAAVRAGTFLAFDGGGNPTSGVIPPGVFSPNLSYTWTAPQTFSGGIQTPALPGLSSTLLPVPGGPYNSQTFGLSLSDVSKPWLIRGLATSPATENPGGLLYVTKGTAYSPAGGPSSGEFPAILGINVISDGVWSNQAAILGSVYNSNTQHSQPQSTASAVAVYGTGWCVVAGCSATWGGVMAAYDISNQINPPHALIGLEIDVYGHGTDTGEDRLGLLIGAGTPDGIAPDIGVGAAIRIATSNAVTGTHFTNLLDTFGSLTAQNGILLGAVTFTGFAFNSPGFSVDAQGAVTGHLLIPATYTVATLPPCNAAITGAIATVDDLVNAPVYNTAIGPGGGTLPGTVVCQGSTWASH
jgi:hypothetical protein